MDADDIKTIIPVTLIVITAVLTALGVFDKIAYYAGAGTVVPITGFANSIVSPAMEHQSEGRILGTGANMFKIAGPVLAYGSAEAFYMELSIICFLNKKQAMCNYIACSINIRSIALQIFCFFYQ